MRRFLSLSPRSNPEQEYFVNGVTESLTTDLSRITGSFIIARNTAFTYKGKPFDVKQIGRDPGSRMPATMEIRNSRPGADVRGRDGRRTIANKLSVRENRGIPRVHPRVCR